MNGINLSGNPGIVHPRQIPLLPVWLEGGLFRRQHNGSPALCGFPRCGYNTHHAKHFLPCNQKRRVAGQRVLEVPELRNIGVFLRKINKGKGLIRRDLQSFTRAAYVDCGLQPA